MFQTLLKKQMSEIFRGYFYDAKKNKKRSTVSTVLFLALYVVIMVGILGGMFGFLSVTLCKPLAFMHMSWLYFLIMSLIAIALGAFGSIFNTYSGLYLSKDNDLLLSLPIPVGSILAARLASVYLLGLMYSAVVIVPAVVVYWIVAPVSVLAVIGSLLLIILISVIVLILSCVLGWCVAKISQKLKNKSFLTVFASLLFLAAYYFVYYKAQMIISDLIAHAQDYGEKLKASVYPLYLFGKIGEGDVPAMLLYTIVIFAICALTFWMLAKSFLSIVSASGKTAKVAYKEKKTRQKSVSSAMLGKEFARFTASPNYMLNCGLGSVFLFIFGGVLLAKGNVFMQMMRQIFGEGGILEMLLALLVSGLFVALMAMVGLVLGLKMPNLTWTNENAPIKQSISVMIAMFGGLILCVGMGALYFIGGWIIGAAVYLAMVAVLFAGLGIGCYVWLKKRGTEIFRWL